MSSSSPPPSLSSFVALHRRLIGLERDAEVAQTEDRNERVGKAELEKRGCLVDKLAVSAARTGMFGRTVVELRRAGGGGGMGGDRPLPANAITAGDIVGLSASPAGSAQIASGVVASVSQAAIAVTFEESREALEMSEEEVYKIVKLANDVTYRRLKRWRSHSRSQWYPDTTV